MAIDWNGLESKIKDYLMSNSTNKDHSEEKTAQFIEDVYLEEMKKNASEMYTNGVLSISVGLKDSLLSAFNASKQLKSGSPVPLNSQGCLGVIQIWSGGSMKFIVPPPGAIVGVSNNVTSPGSVSPMSVSNSDSDCPLAPAIVNVLKKHAQTVSGLLMGVNSNGVPIPGPWSGLS